MSAPPASVSDLSDQLRGTGYLPTGSTALVAHLANTRNLAAGTIVGSGTVSNRDEGGGPGKPVDRGGRGYSCLAEVRTVETITSGQAVTPFLKKGDTVRIWGEDDRHHPIFGVIEQTVE